MQITDYPTAYSVLDFSVPRMMRTVFRAVSTARRFGGSDGRMPGTPVQPRPCSSPAAPALLPARHASPSGVRELRDKGVTYYSVDLGRVQRGGRDDDADRDVTVIPVILGSVRTRGDAMAPVMTCAGSAWPGRPNAGGRGCCRRAGYQFQLRIAYLLRESPRDEPEALRTSPPLQRGYGDHSREPGPHRLSRLLSVPSTSGDTSVVTRLRSADKETSRGVLRVRGCAAVTA